MNSKIHRGWQMSFSESAGYRELKKVAAEQPRDIVAVIGAGMSAQCGLPTWLQLKDHLLHDAEQRQSRFRAEGAPLASTIDIEKLSASKDLWAVMKAINDFLPKSEFEAAIKRQLRHDNPPSPPTALVDLWKIGIKGIVTPNLDNLAADSHARCYGLNVDKSTLLNSVDYTRFLSDDRRFVFQPHGDISQPKSWVFTDNKLQEVISDTRYREWWRQLLSSKNLVFLGINESEFSIKTYVLDNPCGRMHFVVAPYKAESRLQLFNDANFIHVPYSCSNADGRPPHSEVADLVESLVDLQPAEITPPAAFGGVTLPLADLPAPSELRLLSIEDIRSKLNAAVASILPRESDAEQDRLQDFDNLRKEYLESFNVAATVEPKTKYDLLHGYCVLDTIGEGGFGKVFRAKCKHGGGDVAIKVIHPQMLSQGKHLNAFRRGAYAMKLLTDAGVDGLVRLREAFEVPFAIVMDFVEGMDLESAIESKLLTTLQRKLEVVRRVAQVVHAAHSTKDQVLHRDLKPGNVVFEGFEYEDCSPDNYVKLVDFDLCWHKYATAETVIHHKGSRGYAAPEMFDKSLGNTRRASVDVYGLGMLLYFVLAEKHPTPGMQQTQSFVSDVTRDLRHKYQMEWSALAWHLARIIEIATRKDANSRCSLSDFIAMLDTAICLDSDGNASAYLPVIGMQIMEDILHRTDNVDIRDYGREVVHAAGPKVIVLSLNGDEFGLLVQATITRTKDEATEGSHEERRDRRVRERIERLARDAGFEAECTANASNRIAILTRRLKSTDKSSVRGFSEVVEVIWREIDKAS